MQFCKYLKIIRIKFINKHKNPEIFNSLRDRLKAVVDIYIKEVPNEDFADQVICKICGTGFIRE